MKTKSIRSKILVMLCIIGMISIPKMQTVRAAVVVNDLVSTTGADVTTKLVKSSAYDSKDAVVGDTVTVTFNNGNTSTADLYLSINSAGNQNSKQPLIAPHGIKKAVPITLTYNGEAFVVTEHPITVVDIGDQDVPYTIYTQAKVTGVKSVKLPANNDLACFDLSKVKKLKVVTKAGNHGAFTYNDDWIRVNNAAFKWYDANNVEITELAGIDVEKDLSLLSDSYDLSDCYFRFTASRTNGKNYTTAQADENGFGTFNFMGFDIQITEASPKKPYFTGFPNGSNLTEVENGKNGRTEESNAHEMCACCVKIKQGV